MHASTTAPKRNYNSNLIIWFRFYHLNLKWDHSVTWCAISNTIGVNVQLYTTFNILISVQIVSTETNVIRFITATLTVQFILN